MPKYRILAVDDDPEIRDLFSLIFGKDQRNKDEFSYLMAKDGKSGLVLAKEKKPDCIILDWTLGDIPGIEVLRVLRSFPETRFIPVFMVTGRNKTEDKITAIQSGADDYLTKPFNNDELIERVRCIIRRREMALMEHKVYDLGGLSLDISALSVTLKGKPLRLEPKEFDVLALLLKSQNRMLSKQQILDSAWGYQTDSSQHAVEIVVNSLRRKLGPKWSQRLETHKGMGYLFNTR
ncbi:response regulator transcription factor [Elusimicrobiota bacterium]